jgi:hypothetical protein
MYNSSLRGGRSGSRVIVHENLDERQIAENGKDRVTDTHTQDSNEPNWLTSCYRKASNGEDDFCEPWKGGSDD